MTNSLFLRGFARLRQQVRYAVPMWLVLRLTGWFPDNGPACLVRGTLLRPFVASAGKRLRVGRDVTLLNTERLIVGEDVYIAKGCWINAAGRVELATQVMLGPYVVISSMVHGFVDGSAFGAGSSARSVHIGRGSWLAAHVTVSAGASVGSGCAVAANATVIDHIPDDSLAAGVPARRLRSNLLGPGEVKRSTDIS